MATTTTTGVRLTEEQLHWITEYAAFTGKTVSDVIRDAVMETIEDAVDLYEYNQALALDDGEYYTTDDVMRMALEAE